MSRNNRNKQKGNNVINDNQADNKSEDKSITGVTLVEGSGQLNPSEESSSNESIQGGDSEEGQGAGSTDTLNDEKDPAGGELAINVVTLAAAPAVEVLEVSSVKTLEEVKERTDATVVQTEAKETKADVADIGVSVSDNSDLAKLINKIKAEGTPAQKSLVNAMNKYLEDMKPGKIMQPAIGAQFQIRFWEVLRNVVENPSPEEFRRQMFIVRSFFKRYTNEKSALNDHYIHRFSEMWSRGPEQHAALQRLVNIFMLTADPVTTAENLKTVDLARSLQVYFSEQHRQRLISYFQQ